MLETGTDYCNANDTGFVVRQMCKRLLPTAQHGGESNYLNRLSSLFKLGKQNGGRFQGNDKES